MAIRIDSVDLDLNKDDLYGWEFERQGNIVDLVDYAYRNFIGDLAPRVDVVKSGDSYELCFGRPDMNSRRRDNFGGHRRSIAHAISGHKLRCYVMNKHEAPNRVGEIPFLRVQEAIISPFVMGVGKDYYELLENLADKFSFFSDDAIGRFVEYHRLYTTKEENKLYDFLVNLKAQ
jgi:hypothetical protein